MKSAAGVGRERLQHNFLDAKAGRKRGGDAPSFFYTQTVATAASDKSG